MPNMESYENLTQIQKDAIRDAMAASNPEASTEIDTQALYRTLDIYKDDIIEAIQKIDKSVYATVYDNTKTSQRILDFMKTNGAIGRIGFESQLEHYSNIANEYREQKGRRFQVMRKAEEQGEAALTDDERRILTTKTQFESMLESATKTFFEAERVGCLEKVERELRNYERRVIYTPDKSSPDMLKKSINSQLSMFGRTMMRGAGDKENPMVFKFSERDLPRYVYDKAALDEYVNAYDRYVRANVVNIKRAHDIRDLGNTMNDRATELVTMGRDPTYKNMSDDEYSKVHDELAQKYQEAKERYENLVKETESDPAYKAHLNSPEYLHVVNQEYYERKYEGKRFDQIPDHEKPIYVAQKYHYVTGKGLGRIPAEERKLFDKGILIQAMPHVLEMEANLDNVEKTMQKVWAETRNTTEQPFQKKELEENRAILKAYKEYIMDGSKEKQQKFFAEYNKAYDNAKQQFKDHPDMRRRFELRADQLLRGDFTFVPVETRRDAKRYGMTANWDTHTHTREEVEELMHLPKTTAQHQYDRAFSVHVAPVNRKALDYEIEQDVENRPEYTLKEMGQSLKGADLENYKATIRDDKMERFNETASLLNAEIKNAKDQLKSLTKKYGFFGRFFNQHYKNEKTMLENDIDFGSKKYDSDLKKTKYDIYKTYQEKGLALTKKESKELNNIVKEATRTGKIKEWNEAREQEKKRLDEMNKKWLEPDEVSEPQAPEIKVPSTKQLDLSAQIHKPKIQETPQKQKEEVEKTVEKEQKVQKGPDLEK